VGRKPKAVKPVVAAKDGRRVLLVRRRRDGLWALPGGKRGAESESLKTCLKREFREELPQLRLRKYHLWKKVNGVNGISGRRMSDAIYFTRGAKGKLTIGDPREIDKAEWRRPSKLKLTPTARYILTRLLSEGFLKR
jgi:ADP-ribose pyrophosphatase YjhB (NUDIX family)